MPTYYLRVQAANLASFLEDTQELSTIRGGSLALLEGIPAAAAAVPELDPVSVGASAGIYRFEAADDATAADTAQRIRAALVGGAGDGLKRALRHAVFVAAADRDTGDYTSVRQRLSARARRTQMASATLIYPEPEATSPSSGEDRVCSIDLVRPVGEHDRFFTIRGRPNPPVSHAVFDRRGYGLEAKQNLYQGLLASDASTRAVWDRLAKEVPGHAPFAFQLSSIAEGHCRKSLRTSLRDKICVMYADGTGFGDLQNSFIAGQTGADDHPPVDGAARQWQFDEWVHGWRRQLLGALLDVLIDQQAYGTPSDEERAAREKRNADMPSRDPWTVGRVMRFETLLWGGDEQLFVLPARLGWQFAQAFIRQTAGWQLGKQRLDHGIGLIFCHYDAPIARIRDLASRLADEAKTVSRDSTLILPIVLESFDHIGGAPARYFRRRTPIRFAGAAAPAAPFVLDAGQLANLQAVADCLGAQQASDDKTISRRQLRRLAHVLHAEGRPSGPTSPKVQEQVDELWGLLRACLGEDRFASLDDCFAMPSAPAERFWVLLDEFWDYLLPEPAPAQEPGP